jgi:hypothetical protein
VSRNHQVRGPASGCRSCCAWRSCTAIGTWIQMVGVLTALAMGVMPTRANYRNRAHARQ